MKPIAFYPQLALELGDITTAIYYQQLYYWSDKGNRKDGFIYKTKKEIQAETTINPRTQDRHRKKLETMGWLETMITNANGKPTVHYKTLKNIEIAIHDKVSHHTRQSVALGNDKVSHSITESTTENTHTVPKARSSFSSVEELLQAPQKHLVLIGFYLKATKKVIDTPEELTAIVKRWMKDASSIAKFDEDKINNAFIEAKEKYPDLWNLGTVLKILTK